MTAGSASLHDGFDLARWVSTSSATVPQLNTEEGVGSMTAAAMRAPAAPAGADLPPEHLVLGRAGSENFPVASRLLPAPVRVDLVALYGWARLVDELGDDYAGDRLAALDEVEHQFLAALSAAPGAGPGAGAGAGAHPLVARVAEMVWRRRLPAQPLLDLVQANRQ
ncbi:MAG: squalene/phytoene synthase family protein, partial [Acidimicrobiales bacterium]